MRGNACEAVLIGLLGRMYVSGGSVATHQVWARVRAWVSPVFRPPCLQPATMDSWGCDPLRDEWYKDSRAERRNA